jgi:hypothetical protein
MLDHCVEICAATPEPQRNLARNRRLPRAHESDERDVPV